MLSSVLAVFFSQALTVSFFNVIASLSLLNKTKVLSILIEKLIKQTKKVVTIFDHNAILIFGLSPKKKAFEMKQKPFFSL